MYTSTRDLIYTWSILYCHFNDMTLIYVDKLLSMFPNFDNTPSFLEPLNTLVPYHQVKQADTGHVQCIPSTK